MVLFLIIPNNDGQLIDDSGMFTWYCNKGPCYTIPDYIGASRFLYQIGLLFTLRHCNPVCSAEQKSLRFVGDMKCNQQIQYAPVQ